MAAETEYGFIIDGEVYEPPTLLDLVNDECQILYEYSGLVQEDFLPLEGETEEETNRRNEKLMRHPGFWLAFMHIAYRRKHRDVKADKIKDVVGKTNRVDALSGLMGDDDVAGGDAVPPALTSEHDRSSPRSSLENERSTVLSPESSTNGSTTSSDEPDSPPASTTTTGSDTSSTLAQTASAA